MNFWNVGLVVGGLPFRLGGGVEREMGEKPVCKIRAAFLRPCKLSAASLAV